MTFDPEAARTRREYLEKYYQDRENGYHPECEPLCVSEAAEMLPAALDEIARLRQGNLELKNLASEFKKLTDDANVLMEGQAKRIAELEGDLEAANIALRQSVGEGNLKSTRIVELEEALVKERAKRITPYHHHYGEFAALARHQLRQEGLL